MAETRVQGTSEKLPNPNPDSPSKLPEETDSNSGSFVKFVDDSDPLRTIWKRKVLPIVYGTVLAIIAAPLLLGVMISWEVATFSCGFTTIVIGSIGFCIVFIVLSSATFRISDRMSALAGKDIGRIKRLLGERYWGRTTENGELEDRGGWGGARCLNRKLPRE